jgi:zinc protease
MIHPQLAGGDTRIGLPRRETLKAYSLADYKEWFLSQTQFSPVDVMIVGDLTVEAAEAIVAKTVGALPTLAPPPDLEKFRTLPFPKKPFDFTWTVDDTKSQSGFIELYWPLAKNITAADQIRLSLLMDIVQDRMRSTIREAMGKTYSPSAGLERFLDFHHYGWLTVQIEADPAELLRVQKAALEQVAKLLKQGVSADELQRAQQVKAANLERDRQTNGYWQMRLDESARYPELAEFHAQGPEATARATIAEINELAREYLRADQVSLFRIVPKKKAKK